MGGQCIVRIMLVAPLLAVLGLGVPARGAGNGTVPVETPEAPANAAGDLTVGVRDGTFSLRYHDHVIVKGQIFVLVGGKEVTLSRADARVRYRAEVPPGQKGPVVSVEPSVEKGVSASYVRVVTQRIVFSCQTPLVIRAEAVTSEEGLAAELGRRAQEEFPLIRNTVGAPSRNLRNDAVYDRKWDWVASFTSDTSTPRISPSKDARSERRFRIEVGGNSVELDFRPRYYQAHKNIRYFEPWTYRIWPQSVAGWCSWWPYRTGINEQIVAQIADVFSQKLRDYGFEYIQIDDGYQANGYGAPASWLNTNQERFPSGLAGLNKIIRDRGLKPALWVNVHFSDPDTLKQHPEWFVQDPDGAPHHGDWIDYGIDGSNQQALDTLVIPVYRTLREQKWDYVKVDTLRHLLYDCYYPCRSFFEKKNLVAEEVYRHYLTAIRNALGRDTYMLACWGVLPEVAGIADGCRLGGDGFGPTGLIQYNSWNNIVWRNDPDHMDITPEGEEWIRPATVTFAGAQMLLTDKVEVYGDDRNIEGAKRCAPILFTVPGQLYDYDPTKTDNVRAGKRNENGGGPAGPIDADRSGKYCQWWLMEINRPFDRWNVLARMDYQDLPSVEVSFADLGLAADKEYLVFEYRSARFLGVCKGSFEAPAQKAKEVSAYAIRENLGRPQLLATSRHITCGGPDIEALKYENGVLSGTSRLVANDRYRIYVHLPAGYTLGRARARGAQVTNTQEDGEVAVVTLLSDRTRVCKWTVEAGHPPR
jgi:alpha-galactosidase